MVYHINVDLSKGRADEESSDKKSPGEYPGPVQKKKGFLPVRVPMPALREFPFAPDTLYGLRDLHDGAALMARVNRAYFAPSARPPEGRSRSPER